MIPFSVLDLSPIAEGSTASDALRNSLELAQHAEKLGYKRYWLAEHHNMPGIASAATAVVIGHVAGGTRAIRVGSGGIMLPNHSPLVIAEQFGTLEALFPGRIDLGLGRAPGTDPFTTRALRRAATAVSDTFPEDVAELQKYLGEIEPGQRVRAIPGAGTHVPLWLLGSSTFSAQLAAAMGLPFAFASHFAPADLMAALRLYRSLFRPSAQLAKPYAMVGVNVIAADTDEEARYQFTSLQQAFTLLRRGTPGKVPPPIADIDSFWSPMEKAMANDILMFSVVGSAETVERGLRKIIEMTQADELILAAHLYEHKARLRSFEIAAEVRERMLAPKTTQAVTAS
ncbi:MAG TPA: LLM class flavin-dependent oxidoreductase [Candidatus Acidoferrum sp.]|nr:LLM class flavin-dependent oxidoreductase [Candidatus Acidoferrum sp.]